MFFLPELAPQATSNEVFKEGSEEAQVAALEKDLEAKNVAIRDWQKNSTIIGKADAPADVREGLDEEELNEGSIDDGEDEDGEEEL